MSKFARHFFVCTNQRPVGGKPSCVERGSAAVLSALRAGVDAHAELWGQVSVTSSGCLGPCFDGPCMVVYPQGTWYAGVTADNVHEIVEQHLIGGDPVASLTYQWPQAEED